ncbi:amidohydrolase family protein [Burkholderia pyrrocinia]|uniref:amidohydrolase family protein n=1 Tax=Burkholderia pyrrocinia TaxID=60550 RepID=UPI001FC83C1D|nr:amidohydrolase family protein [Burkholderia pyrrocinia]
MGEPMRREGGGEPGRRHADLLVHGGTVMTPSGAERIDVACVGGRVVALGALRGTWSGDVLLDAGGLHVLPGVVDSQVHFREPGLTHKETIEAGTRGAVLGGVTTIFEMPDTHPLTLDEQDLQAKLDLARGRAWCDYAFYIGGSAVNAERLPALESLPGCAGVKVFMGSSFGDLLADDETVLRRILRNGRRRMAVHAEDEARLRDHPCWRDEQSALAATRRIVGLAAETGRRLHVLHVSTADEMALLARHRRRVTVEVTPHHLSEALFDACGARATAASLGLDRFWRNARTHTLHDPLDYRLRDVGRFALTGELPPASLYT